MAVGIGSILEARRCLLLATGSQKADVIARVIPGTVTAMVQVAAFQLHPACSIIHAAVSVDSLRERGGYLWITPGRKGLPIASKYESSGPGGSLRPLAIKPGIVSAGSGGSRLEN